MVMVRTDPPADLQTAVDLQVMERTRNASPVLLRAVYGTAESQPSPSDDDDDDDDDTDDGFLGTIEQVGYLSPASQQYTYIHDKGNLKR
jgi:hypothetical protein